MSRTIQVNEGLSLFVSNGSIAIGREDGGLVDVALPEVRHLCDALIHAAAEQATGKEIGLAAYLNEALTDSTRWCDGLQAENIRLLTERDQARAWARAWKRVATEWRKAAREVVPPLTIPISMVMSSRTTLDDWKRLWQAVDG
jgi:hypothetical protein